MYLDPHITVSVVRGGGMSCQVCSVRSGEGRQNLFVLGFYIPSAARGSPQVEDFSFFF